MDDIETICLIRLFICEFQLNLHITVFQTFYVSQLANISSYGVFMKILLIVSLKTLPNAATIEGFSSSKINCQF